jgi:hypothetical protein
MSRLTITQKLAMRMMGLKVSKDGLRWTAKRNHQALIEKSFRRVPTELWREEGKDVKLVRRPDGLDLVGPNKTMTLRWLP